MCHLSYVSDVRTHVPSITHILLQMLLHILTHTYSSVPDERGDGQYIHTYIRRPYSSDLRTSPASHDTHTLIRRAHAKRGRTKKKEGENGDKRGEKKEKRTVFFLQNLMAADDAGDERD
jgi:hypothetical protein